MLLGKVEVGESIDKGKIYVNVYKNPPSIDKMSKWTRAITDSSGNLYIADDYMLIHTNMIYYLIDNGYIPSHKTNYFSRGVYEDIVAWQRYNNTREFYLSESYSDIEIKRKGREKEILDNSISIVNDRWDKIKFKSSIIHDNTMY